MTGKSGSKSGDVLVAQPHGGALKVGGDHPRPGRPSSEIRRIMRGDLVKVRDRLVEILDDQDAEIKHADLTRMGEFFARFGLGENKYDTELVDELSRAIAEVLAEHQDRDELLSQIKARWLPILAKRARAG